MLETNDQINSLLRFLVYIAHLSRLSTAYYVFLKLNQYALFNQYELKVFWKHRGFHCLTGFQFYILSLILSGFTSSLFAYI